MNILVHDALIDIEQRIQVILEEIRSIREQVFYTYISSDSNNDLQEAFDIERLEAFEHQVKMDKFVPTLKIDRS